MFGSYRQPIYQARTCGLYYLSRSLGVVNLPLVNLEAHATILSTTSRTTLTQRFTNPSKDKGIREVKYSFPLYDGVSVVRFTCLVGERTIVGVVKEKEKAKRDFNEAVAQGQTAGLFQQQENADIFSTSVGNVPPRTDVIIEITYLGELKHDMEVDGIRITIPTSIAPRYGTLPQPFDDRDSPDIALGGSISITIDAEMAEGTRIQKILSPTHPIEVSLGTTSVDQDAEPMMTKASATLSLRSVELGKDFVLQIVAKDTGVPKAILETHPVIPNQRALMATLVPKFALPASRPEVVFICDRSGSMGLLNSRIDLAKQALLVFLKSLPVGVMFNICSFGSHHSFLWPKSRVYSQATLDEAVQHVDMFRANMGGTEMLQPVKATIEQRYKDMPLEIMLLTDGEILDQQQLFSYLNEQISEKKSPIRAFTLGIGDDVSHSLIEGVARAGNGFSQSVGQNEKMDAKVVRMLKGALSPHVTDYTLEVKYDAIMTPGSETEDDFDLVEKVKDCLKVKLDITDGEKEVQPPKKPISLFDPAANPDNSLPQIPEDSTGESRYDYLPTIHAPNIIQAPQSIPSLFAFNRTTIYLLLGPDSPQQTPKSVILRGTSDHGPLELELPVQILERKSEMIHQLAAKKAITELEQGRGWLNEAKNENEELLKSSYESRFSSMVEREAVRLGVKFQVGGKWTSFVAVEKDHDRMTAGEDSNEKKTQKQYENWEWLDDAKVMPKSIFEGGAFQKRALGQSQQDGSRPLFTFANQLPPPTQDLRASNSSAVKYSPISPRGAHTPTNLFSATPSGYAPTLTPTSSFGAAPAVGASSQLFGCPNPSSSEHKPASNPSGSLFGGGGLFKSVSSGGSFGYGFGRDLFGTVSTNPFADDALCELDSCGTQTNFSMAAAPAQSGLFSGQGEQRPYVAAMPREVSLFSQPPQQQMQQQQMQQAASGKSSGFNETKGKKKGLASSGLDPQGTLFRSLDGATPFGANANTGEQQMQKQSTITQDTPSPQSDEDTLTILIRLQNFEGAWPWASDIFTCIKISEMEAKEKIPHGVGEMEWITALVVAFFETRMVEEMGSWELVVEKARGWLGGRVGEIGVEGVVGKAGGMFV